MTHTKRTPLRTQMLFGGFLFAAALGLSTASAVRQDASSNDAFILRTSSSSSLHDSSSSISSHRASSLLKKSSSSARFVRPPIRRKNGTGALHDAAPAAVRTPLKAGCGDGILTQSEQCDDSNAVSGDGCSGSCRIEAGYMCDTAQPSHCWSRCGDGIVASNEKCDDGNVTSGDGCTSACHLELSYKCSGSPSVCAIPSYCGNGVMESGEQCDDGNTNYGDGCTPSCTLQ